MREVIMRKTKWNPEKESEGGGDLSGKYGWRKGRKVCSKDMEKRSEMSDL